MLNKTWKKGPFHFDTIIFLILIFAAILLFFNISSTHIPGWDGADYMRAAAQTYTGDGWKFLGAGYKPAWVTTLFLGFYVFGVHDWVGVLLAGIFGLLTIYFTYLIILKIYGDRAMAWMGALLISVTGYFIYYARIPRPDSMFCFYFLFCLWFYLIAREKGWFWLCVLLIGCGFWIRTTMGLIVPILAGLELLAALKKEIPWARAIIRIVFVVIVVSLFFAFTAVTYSALQPADMTGVSGWEGYSANSHLQVFEILKNPFQHLNIHFYPIILKQLTSWPIIMFLVFGLVAGLYTLYENTFKEWKAKELLPWFAFIYLITFLSFFPQHRYKVFYMVLPYVIIVAVWGIRRFPWRIASFFFLITFFWTLFFSWPLVTYTASSHYEAANMALEDRPGGLITSAHGPYMWYGMFSDGASYALPKDRFKKLQNVETMEELEELYNEGYTHIIMDERCCIPLRDELLQAEHLVIGKVWNDIWETDPVINGNYEQVKYLTKNDEERRVSWIELRQKNDTSYEYINIYRVKDVLKLHS